MNKEVIEVLSKDFVMAGLIDKYGLLDFEFEYRTGTPFVDLFRQIIGQQLSIKAASSIWKRVILLVQGGEYNDYSKFTPQAVLSTSDTDYREAGLSFNKIKYVKNIAIAVLDGSLCFEKFEALTDEEIIAVMTKIKGVGRWTAEMFLMFTLGRPNVFSIGDLGLWQAACNLYGVASNSEILQLSKQWEPYKSYASLYLWETLNNKI